jgi:rSAM/selenodomain-associated transferase 1
VTHSQGRLLVFAKAPVPGAVKTRLIPTLGAQGAARLHEQLILRTLSQCRDAGACPIELWCAPETSHPFFQHCASVFGVPLHAQHGDGLGKRMSHALTSTLKDHSYAVLLGSDCGSLGPELLNQACAALSRGKAAVIAPAEDGGYVLLGLRRTDPGLFVAIPWGTDQVMAITRERLAQRGWEWLELPRQWDVDRPEDLARLEQSSGFAHPR